MRTLFACFLTLVLAVTLSVWLTSGGDKLGATTELTDTINTFRTNVNATDQALRSTTSTDPGHIHTTFTSTSITGLLFTNATGTGNLDIATLHTSGAINGSTTLTIQGTTDLRSTLAVASTLGVTGLTTLNETRTGSTTITGLTLTNLINNLNATGTVSSVSNCGTSPTIVGTSFGRVTTGSNASSTCTVTFGKAFTNTPVCTVSSQTTSSVGYMVTPASTTLVISTASSSAFISNTLNYSCIGI